MATAEEYATWIVANADKKGTPEFNTVAQAYNLAKSGAVKPKAPIETPQFEKDAAAIANATPAQVIAGFPAVRFAIGASDPIRGAVQMGANAVGLGGMFNENEAQLEQLMNAGKVAYGVDGIDGDRLAGNVLSPVGLALAKVAGPAGSALQRLRQGGTIGAVSGATTPVPDATGAADYFGKAGTNAAIGTGVGVALPAGVEGVKAGARSLRNILDGILAAGGNTAAAQRAGGRLANEVAGANAPAVRTALEASQDFVPGGRLTAGQAAVPSNSAEFAALQKIAEQANPSVYAGPAGVDAAQENARKALIATIANDPAFANKGGDPIAAAKALREANAKLNFGRVRGDMINPLSMEEVLQARIASKTNDSAKALADAKLLENPNRYSGNRMAEDAVGFAQQKQAEANFIRYQLDSLIKTVGEENPKLTALLQRPSMQKALLAAQQGAEETAGYFPAKAGDPFSVGNLQRMKMALDDIIKDPKTFGIKATEAMEIGSTRDEFVKWFGKRSPGWAAARDKYAADSVPINRMQIGKVLGDALDTPTGVGDRPTSFANALENARLTQKKANGQIRYETIDEALGPEGIAKAKMVMQDLVNNANFDKMAASGASAAGRIAGRNLDVVPNPHFLSKASTIFNMLMHPVESVSKDKILRQLAVDMQNPKEMARLMREATPAQRKALTDYVMRLGTANAANVKEATQ